MPFRPLHLSLAHEPGIEDLRQHHGQDSYSGRLPGEHDPVWGDEREVRRSLPRTRRTLRMHLIPQVAADGLLGKRRETEGAHREIAVVPACDQLAEDTLLVALHLQLAEARAEAKIVGADHRRIQALEIKHQNWIRVKAALWLHHERDHFQRRLRRHLRPRGADNGEVSRLHDTTHHRLDAVLRASGPHGGEVNADEPRHLTGCAEHVKLLQQTEVQRGQRQDMPIRSVLKQLCLVPRRQDPRRYAGNALVQDVGSHALP
eukprot:scaffold964_cov261-Pinguiococcus_pyrenoidosus.AAC.25